MLRELFIPHPRSFLEVTALGAFGGAWVYAAYLLEVNVYVTWLGIMLIAVIGGFPIALSASERTREWHRKSDNGATSEGGKDV